MAAQDTIRSLSPLGCLVIRPPLPHSSIFVLAIVDWLDWFNAPCEAIVPMCHCLVFCWRLVFYLLARLRCFALSASTLPYTP